MGPFDPYRLPPLIAALVERTLRDGEGHEVAIEAIEQHLADGGERTPDLLVALATLTYDDAATALLHQLGQASQRAMELVDEAVRRGASCAAVESLRGAFQAACDRERARERRLRLLAIAPERARPTELAELALRLRLAGDDGAAGALMAEAAERLPDDDAEAHAQAS